MSPRRVTTSLPGAALRVCKITLASPRGFVLQNAANRSVSASAIHLTRSANVIDSFPFTRGNQHPKQFLLSLSHDDGVGRNEIEIKAKPEASNRRREVFSKLLPRSSLVTRSASRFSFVSLRHGKCSLDKQERFRLSEVFIHPASILFSDSRKKSKGVATRVFVNLEEAARRSVNARSTQSSESKLKSFNSIATMKRFFLLRLIRTANTSKVVVIQWKLLGATICMSSSFRRAKDA
jgi:hypothetical protein